MVQITFDTNNDSLEELEQAMEILQTAISKRSGKKTQDKQVTPELEEEKQEKAPAKAQKAPETVEEEKEEEDDTPFIKITVHKSNDDMETDESDSRKAPETASKAPTLNQLISDEGITEEELTRMFKVSGTEEKKAEQKRRSNNDDAPAYLEIVEYEDNK